MRILAVNGSERPHGGTAAVLSTLKERMQPAGVHIEVLNLCERDIQPCSCGSCNSRPTPCPVSDDVGAIVGELVTADGVLLAAPVHGFGLSSTMQLFLERAGVGFLRFGRPLTNKVGGVIVTGRRYSHGEVYSQLLRIMLLNRLIIPGSGFPAVINTAGPEGALGDQEGVDASLRLVERMAELHFTLRSARSELAVPASVELRVGRTE